MKMTLKEWCNQNDVDLKELLEILDREKKPIDKKSDRREEK